MLNEQDRGNVDDRSDLLKAIARHKSKTVKLLNVDVLNPGVGIYKFELTFSMTPKDYSECINSFLKARDKRIENITKKLKTRYMKKGDEIECHESELILKCK